MDYLAAIFNWLKGNYLIVLGFLTLLALYLKDIYEHGFWGTANTDPECLVYTYDACKGPHVWKDLYPGARGDRQSPINIISCYAINIPVETCTPLTYSTSYHLCPCDMLLNNSGHNVVIYANWQGCDRPTISGGPLKSKYTFCSITFRWGPSDDEGSEHMVDAKRFAMELQATFVKGEMETVGDLSTQPAKNLLIVSYFLMVTPMDNPYMEQIVSALGQIKAPFATVPLDPMPLTFLAPCFSRRYISYVGSLTYPPCMEGVKWIVQPEALTISGRQVRKFRKLIGINGPILSNVRPVQKLNNRDIFFYD